MNPNTRYTSDKDDRIICSGVLALFVFSVLAKNQIGLKLGLVGHVT
jgi:hypothetical protein